MASKVVDLNPLIFDRKPSIGKKCTAVISYDTFLDLEISKEYIDSRFKTIILRYGKKQVFINTNVIRLNRFRLETDLSRSLDVKNGVNAEIKDENKVIVNSEVYEGIVIDASGWKGKAKWVKAIEYLYEPIESDVIEVIFDKRNKGGFSWIVPLPYGTLVGALSYQDPEPFVPKLNKVIIDKHGGAIPRTLPVMSFKPYKIGDRTGLIKTFTGGGIFGIAKLLKPLTKAILSSDDSEYIKTYIGLAKEIKKQYTIVSALERLWNIFPLTFTLLNNKSINAYNEFDFHSMLFRIPH
ncbi:MAG: NAD(P)/FAD-dependent oxidoreductase [Sulfolobus sp.]|nr:NAD(P)/FAD-dependent oxidoreductase [Sulfolobus sp.]